MMTPEQIAELAAKAAATTDHTETTTGGDFQPPVEGTTVVRFIEYIELGKQPQKPWQGKAKPDADEVRLTFELLAVNKNRTDVREIEVDGVKRTVADRISVRIAIKQGEKAAFKKLFEKMRYGREGITHMAQMLGMSFVAEVVHGKSADGKKTYANLRNEDGVWTIRAPRINKGNAIDGDDWVDIKVREAISPLRCFIWDYANKESWDSLFIDGTRTVKDDKGVEREVSKNWLQEVILSAKNYHGSPLEALLNNIGGLSLDAQEPDNTLDGIPDEGANVHERASEEDLSFLDDDIPF